jgi:hypothetical protein
MDTVFWGNLPREIVRIVLTYEGTLKERNGMYMNQLSPSDKRYALLRTRSIPKEMMFGPHFDIIVYFRNSLFILYVGSGYGGYNDVVYHGDEWEELELDPPPPTHDNDDVRYVFTRRNHAITPSMCYFRK